MTRPWLLAEVNISLPVAPLDSAQLADFVAALEPLNALADAAPGFVWRLQTEDGDATAVRVLADERLIVNLTVWSSLDTLAAFVFRSAHTPVMRRRREWFVPMRDAMTCLWWTQDLPAVAEAEVRLATLRNNGPTPAAFTFHAPFPAPGAVTPTGAADDDWFCPA